MIEKRRFLTFFRDFGLKLNKLNFFLSIKKAAKKYFSRAFEIAESNKAIVTSEVRHYALTLLGHELILEEEYDKARDAFRKAIHISPNIINAWIGIAQGLFLHQSFLFRLTTVITLN